MRQPLIWENHRDDDDVLNYYNPDKYKAPRAYAQQRAQSLATIDPVHPTGLEPAPEDPLYEVVPQMRQPLIWENHRDDDDVLNYYNPDKYTAPRAYVQLNKEAEKTITPTKQDGIVPHPKDPLYEVPPQLKQPLVWENHKETDDFKHYYNPDKGSTPQAYEKKSEITKSVAQQKTSEQSKAQQELKNKEEKVKELEKKVNEQQKVVKETKEKVETAKKEAKDVGVQNLAQPGVNLSQEMMD